jgi:hypothetical protein
LPTRQIRNGRIAIGLVPDPQHGERLLENFVDEAAILWPEKRRRAT